MRILIRNQMLEVLKTIEDGIKQAEKSKEKETCFTLLCDCHQGLNQVLGILNRSLSTERYEEYAEFFEQLLELLETMNALSQQEESTKEVYQVLKKAMKQLEKELQNEIEVKYEVVFMPYKVSMWDSLESIWREAKSDPRCECYVVVLPYYDRDTSGTFGEFHDEVELFPSEVQAISHKDYDISKRTPEVVYIHNPYDENNHVTSVHPDFYSYELKKHAEKVVYVPYCLHSESSNQAGMHVIYQNILSRVDYAVCQDHYEKKRLVKQGCKEKQLLDLGNPKFDGVFYHMEHPPVCPPSWENVIQGKKVLLYNLTINFVLRYNFEYVVDQVHTILQNNQVVLLFRPHPLLKSTFQSMKPHLLASYEKLLQFIQKHPNGMIDEEKDVYTGFYYSHGMMSGYSSLVNNYILTEKPILILKENPLYKGGSGKYHSIYNTSNAYFPKIKAPYMQGDIRRLKESLNVPPYYFRKEWDEEVGKEVWKWETLEGSDGVADEGFRKWTLYLREEGEFVVTNRSESLEKGWEYNTNPFFSVTLVDVPQFLQEILIEGNDWMREGRLSIFREKAVYCHGDNGTRIHKEIMKKIKDTSKKV